MSRTRPAVALGAAFSVCLLAAVHAQTPACDTPAVANDPVTWGSEGNYSLSHVLEDVAAALRWLRQPAVADSYRVNTRRLILVGHSLGGFAALHGAVADNGVRAVAALAPADFGRRGERLKDPEAFMASVRRLAPQLGPLRGT